MPSSESSDAQTISVRHLYRYPVKGLTAEALERVDIAAGETMPGDRVYAIENGAGRFDPLTPRHLPKVNFLMLMRNERLASLRATFDDSSQTLTLFRDGRQVAKGKLDTAIGRQLVEQFLSSYCSAELRGAPKIVNAPGHSFSDVDMKCLHIVNLKSIKELERVSGRTIDPLRFRANVYIDGAQPWQEFEWIGRRLAVGGTTMDVIARTSRCDAINVDPSSAVRDLSIPGVLQRQWGHVDFGIYARVLNGGAISIGDAVEAASATAG